MAPLTEFGALILVAFAGGAFGAALGGLQAYSLAGLTIVVGEAAAIVQRRPPPGGPADVGGLDPIGMTADIGLGPALGPHVAFGGAVAAAAYAARRGYMDTAFDYHEAKHVSYPLGTRLDVLVVGGLFGVVGLLLARLSSGLALPWHPVFASIVASAALHRLVFGYPALGDLRANPLDMSPFARGERRTPLDGSDDTGRARYLVEPWLPHQSAWPNVALLGIGVGVFGAFTTAVTGSVFLAFGLTAASLLFVAAGQERMPVTHHMALPPAIAVAGLAGTTNPADLAAAVPLWQVVLVGAGLGALMGVIGELGQRVFYAHADTYFDPSAVAIVVGTFIIALLDILGIFAQDVVPTLGL